MSGEAWGTGSGFIARPDEEHGDGKGGQVLRDSPWGKHRGGGCVAFLLFFFFLSIAWLSLATGHLDFTPLAQPVVPVGRVVPAVPCPRRGGLYGWTRTRGQPAAQVLWVGRGKPLTALP